MGGIHPEGEALRRAVRYVSEALSEDPDQPLAALVDRASLRFDLKPNEADYLMRFCTEAHRRRSD